MANENLYVTRLDSEGREVLSDRRARCDECGEEGWLGDWPGQGGIVPDPRDARDLCDECAAIRDALIDYVRRYEVVR